MSCGKVKTTSVVKSTGQQMKQEVQVSGFGVRASGFTFCVSNLVFDPTQGVSKIVCQKQFPHKSVNLFFVLVIVKNELPDLWWS